MRRALLWLLLPVGLGLANGQHLFAGQAEHVVVVVWDGLRPDFVTAQYAPTLHALATAGTFSTITIAATSVRPR